MIRDAGNAQGLVRHRSSRGFGRVWARAALERGDSVVATARSVDAVADLVADYPDRALALPLDVTDRGAVIEAVRAGHEHFGRLDVIVNNAGFGLFAAVEETTEAQARAQLGTNLLGPLWVVQATLPYLRAQGSGHILQVSSLSGVATFPLLGLYQASKWALEGLSETLAGEVAGFGIKVTLLEPGAFRTEWAGVSADHAEEMPAYDGRPGEHRRARELVPPRPARGDDRVAVRDRRLRRAAVARAPRTKCHPAGEGRVRIPAGDLDDVGVAGIHGRRRRLT